MPIINPGNTISTGSIGQTLRNTNTDNPIVFSQDIQGGLTSVNTALQRRQISARKLQPGSIVYERDNDRYYRFRYDSGGSSPSRLTLNNAGRFERDDGDPYTPASGSFTLEASWAEIQFGTSTGDNNIQQVDPVTASGTIPRTALAPLDAAIPRTTPVNITSGDPAATVATLTGEFFLDGATPMRRILIDVTGQWIPSSVILRGSTNTPPGTDTTLTFTLVTGQDHEWQVEFAETDLANVDVTIQDLSVTAGIFYNDGTDEFRLDNVDVTEDEIRNLGYDTVNNLDIRYQAIEGTDAYARESDLSTFVTTTQTNRSLDERLPVTVTEGDAFPPSPSNGDMHFLTDNVLDSSPTLTPMTRSPRFPASGTQNTVQTLTNVTTTRPDVAGDPEIIAGTVQVSVTTTPIPSTVQSRTAASGLNRFRRVGGRDHTFRGINVRHVTSDTGSGNTNYVSTVTETRYNNVQWFNSTTNQFETIVGATWHDYFYRVSLATFGGGSGAIIQLVHMSVIRASGFDDIGNPSPDITASTAISTMAALVNDDSSLDFPLGQGSSPPAERVTRSGFTGRTFNVNTNVSSATATEYEWIPMNGFTIDTTASTIAGVSPLTLLPGGILRHTVAGQPAAWNAVFTRTFQVPGPGSVLNAPGQYVYDDITGTTDGTANWLRMDAHPTTGTGTGSLVPHVPVGQGNDSTTNYDLRVAVDGTGERTISWEVDTSADPAAITIDNNGMPELDSRVTVAELQNLLNIHGGGVGLPFTVTTSDVTTLGTAFTLPSTADEREITYLTDSNTLIFNTGTGQTAIPNGTVVALDRSLAAVPQRYTFIVHSSQNFGDFIEYHASPANTAVDTAVTGLGGSNGVTVEGTERRFAVGATADEWLMYQSGSEHVFTFSGTDSNSVEFSIPLDISSVRDVVSIVNNNGTAELGTNANATQIKNLLRIQQGAQLPFTITTSEVDDLDAVYSLPRDTGDREITYLVNENRLIFNTPDNISISNGTVIAVSRNGATSGTNNIFTFIVTGNTDFGDFREYQAHPAATATHSTLAGITANTNDIRVEGEERQFTIATDGGVSLWRVYPSGSQHEFTFSGSDADNVVFNIPFANSSILPGALASGATTPSASTFYRGDGSWHSVTERPIRVNDVVIDNEDAANFQNSGGITFNAFSGTSGDGTAIENIQASLTDDSVGTNNLEKQVNTDLTQGRFLTVGAGNTITTRQISDIVSHEFTPLGTNTISWTTARHYPVARWTATPDTSINDRGFTGGVRIDDDQFQGIPRLATAGNVISNMEDGFVSSLLAALNSGAMFANGHLYRVEVVRYANDGRSLVNVDNIVDSNGNSLNGGQVLFFTATGVDADGNLSTTQTWDTPNVGTALPSYNDFTTLRVTDYGDPTMRVPAINIADYDSDGLNLMATTPQTITVSGIMGSTNVDTNINEGNRVFVGLEGITSTPPVPANSVMEIASINGPTSITIAPGVYNHQTDARVTTGLPDFVEFSPSGAQTYRFQPVDENRGFQTHEIHTLTGTGNNAGSVIATEQHITLSVPTAYNFGVDGGRMRNDAAAGVLGGTGVNRGALSSDGITPIEVTLAAGSTLILSAGIPNALDPDITPNLRISPNPSGYPYIALGRRAGASITTLTVDLNSVVGLPARTNPWAGRTNAPIYFSIERDESSMTFSITNGPTGVPVTQSSLNLAIDADGADFLTEVGRAAMANYPGLTIATATRTDPNNAARSQIILDTNQVNDVTVGFTINDVGTPLVAADPMFSDASVRNPEGDETSRYTVAYASADASRNFSITVSSAGGTLASVMNTIQTDVGMAAPGWMIDNSNNVLTFTSSDTVGETGNFTVSVMEPMNGPAGDIAILPAEVQNGGENLYGFGDGLNLNPSTGVLSSTASITRIADSADFVATGIDHTRGNLFTIGAGAPGDAGQNATNIIDALFGSSPTGTFEDIPLDRDILVTFEDRTRFVPSGTLITYELPSGIPTITIGNIFADLDESTNQSITISTARTYNGEVILKAGTGVQFSTSTATAPDDQIEISIPQTTNPTGTTVTTDTVEAIRNNAVRFGDWILSNGFVFPDVTNTIPGGAGGIRINIAGTMYDVNVYEVNSQNYYFVADFFGGSWIAGTVTNGTTYTVNDIRDRTISSFSTTQ